MFFILPFYVVGTPYKPVGPLLSIMLVWSSELSTQARHDRVQSSNVGELWSW